MTVKLFFVRQGTNRPKTVELCLQEDDDSPFMVFELDIARAYMLSTQLQKFAAPHIEELLR